MKNNENGRSMVEMLGVLAIIGVLSVAGIAGYTMAIDRYHANEILATASKLHMLYEANKDINVTGAAYGDLSEAGLENPYGSVKMEIDENGKVTVTNAGTNVCKSVMSVFGENQDFTIDCS